MKMSHTLDISNTQPLKPVLSMSGSRPEIIFEVSSTCSCPQCNSIDCFKIRYENANLQCTCPSCKYASHKNMQSKKPSDASYRELFTKVKDANDKPSLNTTTSSKLLIKKSDEEFNGKASKDAVKEVAEDSIHTNINKNMANTKPDGENLPTKNSELSVTRKILKEREQKDSLNHDIIKNIMKQAEQRDILSSKVRRDLTNKKKSDGQFYSHERRTNREDEKNCTICDKKHKHKDSLNSVIKYSKSYYSSKNYKSCETNMRDDKRPEQKFTLNTCCKDDLPHKNYSDIRYRKITKKLVNEHVQTDHTFDKHIKEENQEVDLCERTNFRNKNTYIKDKVKKTERSYEKSYTRNYSVAMTYTRKEEKTEFENPTATLSAQIMDLPYQDFKDSLSLHKSAGIINSSKITKQDILAKLKEIYKACSCKVCECIPSLSGNYVSKNDTCAQLDKQIPQRDCQLLPHSGCPCYRCDRKDCRGVWKKEMAATMNCDCKPCDCVQFSQSLTKRCDCEPCQCAECTPMNTHLQRPVIVAPVQGNFQQSRCQCEPCECANCTQNYGAVASSLMREVSTGMVSQRNCNCNSCVSNVCQFDEVDCGCDTQNKIVRKPIDRSGRDYDLRQAFVGENSLSRKPTGKFKNDDTIAMFTFADNSYSNAGFSKSEDDRHSMDCQFSFCADEEKHGIKIKNAYEDEDTPLVFSNLSDKSLNVNKCQPCECRWCCRNEEAESDVMKTTRALNDCSCNTCNCMACKGLENVFADHNRCRPNEILFYKTTKSGEGLSDNVGTEFLYSLKKGNLLTPAMFEAKIRSSTKTQKQSGLSIIQELLPSNTILKLSGKNSSKKLLSTQNLTKPPSNSVEKDFNGDHYQLSYKSMNSKYANHSNIHIDSIIKDEGELFNSQVSNVRGQSKVSNSDVDLYFSRIECLEKSLYQLQEDISLNRKKLSEIWSKGDTGKFGSSTKLDFDDNIVKMKNSYENRITDAEKCLDINEETITLQKLEHETRATNNKGENGTNNNIVDKIKLDQNDSFSKGDNKMYTQPVKRFQKSVTRSKKHNKRSKFKKLSKNCYDEFIDFITEHLKANYKHHGYNLTRKCTKSASTSYENCSELNKLKFEEDARLPLKEVYESNAKLWSVLRKNLYVNDTTVPCNDDEKTDCNIPELEINTKRAVQSISLQTNENRGHAALAKLQTEVSKLLHSPLLQLGYIKTYLISDMDKENFGNTTNYCSPKTNLDLELKHTYCDASLQTSKLTLLVEKEINCDIGQSMEDMKIDMVKLLDFLLTRTVCKSELTRPIAPLSEMLTIPKVNYVKSSCEGLKASFLAVRKVSDHTVLVRWKVPREIENVQGYELQVDGRTVQKILSPTRCVAVLTCLPHCDKLLLTVRTLTLSLLPSGCRPAATIVYYPREKRPRHTQRNMSLHAGSWKRAN